MALFTLADLHLSLSGEKPMDVFGGQWNDFENRLKNAWNQLVSPEDTVVIPGDISWGMTVEEAAADLAFIHALPGQKILMKGNHDYWWTSLKKLTEFCEKEGFSTLTFLHNDALYAQGKVLCGSRGWMCEEKMTAQDQKVLRREALRFGLSLAKGKGLADAVERETGCRPEILAFSHYPVVSTNQTENPIAAVLAKAGVKRVYYGHLHNWGTKPLMEEWLGMKLTLVSSDHLRFCPLEIL